MMTTSARGIYGVQKKEANNATTQHCTRANRPMYEHYNTRNVSSRNRLSFVRAHTSSCQAATHSGSLSGYSCRSPVISAYKAQFALATLLVRHQAQHGGLMNIITFMFFISLETHENVRCIQPCSGSSGDAPPSRPNNSIAINLMATATRAQHKAIICLCTK